MGARRTTGATLPFPKNELARLKQQTADESPLERPNPHVLISRRAQGSSPPVNVMAEDEAVDAIARSRTETLADPMTMSLLAEVARADVAEPAAPESPHPHVKRRG